MWLHPPLGFSQTSWYKCTPNLKYELGKNWNSMHSWGNVYIRTAKPCRNDNVSLLECQNVWDVPNDFTLCSNVGREFKFTIVSSQKSLTDFCTFIKLNVMNKTTMKDRFRNHFWPTFLSLGEKLAYEITMQCVWLCFWILNQVINLQKSLYGYYAIGGQPNLICFNFLWLIITECWTHELVMLEYH
jgi:hypothetical protein